jgi:hypothetical protein
MEWSSTTINRKLRSARLVNKRAAKLEWKNPDSKGPGSSAIHRCVRHGLGSKLHSTTDNLRTLESTGETSTHQSSRIKSDILRSTLIQESQQSNNLGKNGQHNMRGLYQPSGRYNLRKPVTECRKTLEFMSETKNNTSSETYSGNTEYSSRSSIPTKAR